VSKCEACKSGILTAVFSVDQRRFVRHMIFLIQYYLGIEWDFCLFKKLYGQDSFEQFSCQGDRSFSYVGKGKKPCWV